MQSTISNEADVRAKAQDTASTLVDQAQQVATTQVATQQERVASTLDTVAGQLRQSGSNMRDQQPQVAALTDEAARRVESASSYLREHDLNDLIRETETFARREPWLFLGGAFAIGFLGARFLKTSAPARPRSGAAPYRASSSDYGSAWANTRSTIGDDYTGPTQSAGATDYPASDATYHTSGTDYGIDTDTGVRGVGADLDAGYDIDVAEDATDPAEAG